MLGYWWFYFVFSFEVLHMTPLLHISFTFKKYFFSFNSISVVINLVWGLKFFTFFFLEVLILSADNVCWNNDIWFCHWRSGGGNNLHGQVRAICGSLDFPCAILLSLGISGRGRGRSVWSPNTAGDNCGLATGQQQQLASI